MDIAALKGREGRQAKHWFKFKDTRRISSSLAHIMNYSTSQIGEILNRILCILSPKRIFR